LQDLYYADARRIAVIGLGPLGCAPHVVLHRSSSSSGLDERNCMVEVNDLIKGYNVMLETRLEKLRSELPNSDILFCDVYSGILEIISNPKIYGMANFSFFIVAYHILYAAVLVTCYYLLVRVKMSCLNSMLELKIK
jgi:phospholipase/lecithinase/hemolysin